MALSEPDFVDVDELAEEFAQRWRGGDRPSVEDYVARYPHWEEPLREVLSAVVLMESLKAGSDTPPPRPAPPPERVGDFRILREIGRGGMGVVYEAVQEALGRKVAIKVLPAHLSMNATFRERFRREAQASARLHHTNIVPVFGVGEENGLCYIVMQRIVGRGLEAVWRRRGEPSGVAPRSGPTFPGSDARPRAGRSATDVAAGTPPGLGGTHVESAGATAGDDLAGVIASPVARAAFVARVGEQVAEALGYAHQQGILHRDVKPGNLLLDEQGTVWVSDFGLAKIAEDRNLTQTGDLVGTLRYMAPERFRGQSDARSDVYSLGVTLYELAVLRPAFPDTDANRLIHEVTQQEPPRPRRLEPGLPADFETIVLKAMARDPAHRYATARELADDLRRFLEDRPIQARRANVVQRGWRWCRRNRTVATLAATTLGLLALVALVATVGYLRERHARADEREQRARAEKTTTLAVEVLDRTFDRFAPQRSGMLSGLKVEGAGGETVELPTQPVLSKEAAALLEDLLVFYDRLAQPDGDDLALRRKVAAANQRIGAIHHRLGNTEQAVPAYERAIRLYVGLQQQSGKDAESTLAIARIHNELGRVYWETQQPDRELAAYQEAIRVLSDSPSAGAFAFRYELARTHYLLGRRPNLPALARQGPPRERGERFGGGPPWARGERPPGGMPPRERGGREGGSMREAISILQGLVAAHPESPECGHLLALCYRDEPRGRRGRPGNGETTSLDRATRILKELADRYPDVPEYQHDLAETVGLAGGFGPGFPPGIRNDSEERLRQALGIIDRLVAAHPNVPEYAVTQIDILFRLGTFPQRPRPDGEPEKLLRKASAILAGLMDRFPGTFPYRLRRANLDEALARLTRESQPQRARMLLEAALRLRETLLDEDAGREFLQPPLAQGYADLAGLLLELNEPEAALEAECQAEALWRGMPPRRGPSGGPPGGPPEGFRPPFRRPG